MQQRIRQSFERQSFLATFATRLSDISEGRVELTAPIGTNALQQQGFGHAGLTFALGDSAAGYAALTLLPEDQEVVTSEMSIHLLSPAQGEALIARGRVIRAGRRLIVVQSDVFALQGGTESHIAMLSGTMVPVRA